MGLGGGLAHAARIAINGKAIDHLAGMRPSCALLLRPHCGGLAFAGSRAGLGAAGAMTAAAG